MPGARGLIVRLLIAAGHPGGPHIAPAVMERYTELVIDEAVAACREIEQRYPMASNPAGWTATPMIWRCAAWRPQWPARNPQLAWNWPKKTVRATKTNADNYLDGRGERIRTLPVGNAEILSGTRPL